MRALSHDEIRRIEVPPPAPAFSPTFSQKVDVVCLFFATFPAAWTQHCMARNRNGSPVAPCHESAVQFCFTGLWRALGLGQIDDDAETLFAYFNDTSPDLATAIRRWRIVEAIHAPTAQG